jgi:hypothetical protein
MMRVYYYAFSPQIPLKTLPALQALVESSDLRRFKTSRFPRHQFSTLRGNEAFKLSRLNAPGRSFGEHEAIILMERTAPEPLGQVRAVPRT